MLPCGTVDIIHNFAAFVKMFFKIGASLFEPSFYVILVF